MGWGYLKGVPYGYRGVGLVLWGSRKGVPCRVKFLKYTRHASDFENIWSINQYRISRESV